LLCFFKGSIICANTRAAVARKEGEGKRASGKEWEKKVADCEGEKEKETRQGKSEEGNREHEERKVADSVGGENGAEEQREQREGNTERAKGITEGIVTD
jgi:hypothetical protein